MDEAVKERWITALRSGDYDQTEEKLTNGRGGYCCLGVLCEILVPDGLVEKSESETFYSYGDSESTALLPGNLSKVLGLAESGEGAIFDYSEVKDLLTEEEQEKVEANWQLNYEGAEVDPDSKWSLANLNDAGVSFDTIAKIIEEKL